MKFYIASKLENVAEVRSLKAILEGWGWEHTYDWTVHGSVQKEGIARIAEVAMSESEGVYTADVVIVMLPGGRGTHVELGIALGLVDAVILEPNEEPILRIFVCGDVEKDFGTGGTTCAFYHHPLVTCCPSWDNLLARLGALR